MYCYNCGKEIDDKAVVCVQCGCSVTPHQAIANDKPSALLAILCFFIPVLGLILYAIYDGKNPRKAKSVGKAALAGLITSIVLTVLIFVLYFVGIFALIAWTVSV